MPIEHLLLILAKIFKYNIFLCSGAILDEKHILTLARCFNSETDTQHMIVKTGDYSANHWDIDERVYGIKNITFYKKQKDYNTPVLAIIKIRGRSPEYPILTDNRLLDSFIYRATIQPICLPNINTLATIQNVKEQLKDYTMIGWGVSHNHRPTSILRGAPVKLLMSVNGSTICNVNFGLPTEHSICAVGQREPVAGCINDYGSLLVTAVQNQYYLLGLWYASVPECSPHSINYFLKVEPFLSWIWNVTTML